MPQPTASQQGGSTKPAIISAVAKQEAGFLEKIEAFQTVIVFSTLVIVYFAAGYFFYADQASLKSAPKSFTVPLPAEIKTFDSVAGSISFDGLDALPKYIQSLKDNSITILEGSKGRDNPFDSYAAPRPTR